MLRVSSQTNSCMPLSSFGAVGAGPIGRHRNTMGLISHAVIYVSNFCVGRYMSCLQYRRLMNVHDYKYIFTTRTFQTLCSIQDAFGCFDSASTCKARSSVCTRRHSRATQARHKIGRKTGPAQPLIFHDTLVFEDSNVPYTEIHNSS